MEDGKAESTKSYHGAGSHDKQGPQRKPETFETGIQAWMLGSPSSEDGILSWSWKLREGGVNLELEDTIGFACKSSQIKHRFLNTNNKS